MNKIGVELDKIKDSEKRNRIARFIIAALSSIPWIGGFFGATASLLAEREQSESNELYELWLQEHTRKIDDLGKSIAKILTRFKSFGDRVNERLESEEYLQLVTKGFRIYDKADSETKREFIRRLLANSVATNLSSDDVIQLFLDWIEKYNDLHLYVIKYVYSSPGITRGAIWDRIYDFRPKENSSEADLYKLLFRDLSTGGVIRQHREVDYNGNYIKKTARRKSTSSNLKSAFDDYDSYELTELGSNFVHYCMEDIVPQIGES
ncbi:hypothetical protein GGR27_003795 [Lewinella antarctica]|uniref:Uncharacterized protein n=2 Tax=Neolewinella antarctica TaxID=442734 RepID=A0ABX0XGE6_9BACT|nr:hypothetical protein [Neolewinella antarctica]